MSTNRSTELQDQEQPSLVVGRIVGFASLFVGALLALLWLAIRVKPDLAHGFAVLPFFDGPLRLFYERPYVATFSSISERVFPVAAHLVIALLLLGTGFLILRRRALAPLLFLVSGWGGFLFVVLAAWPGERLLSKMEFGLNAARHQGMVGPEGTLLDLVPTKFLVAGVGFFCIWVLLLVVGSVHLLRRRRDYNG